MINKALFRTFDLLSQFGDSDLAFSAKTTLAVVLNQWLVNVLLLFPSLLDIPYFKYFAVILYLVAVLLIHYVTRSVSLVDLKSQQQKESRTNRIHGRARSIIFVTATLAATLYVIESI